MNYEFPVITTIDDVRRAVSGVPSIIEVVKDGYTVFNYTVADPTTFPHVESNRDLAIRRECRGLMFDNGTGLVISRPFHKFFNLDEREETRSSDIDWSGVSFVPKFDGSFVRPFKTSKSPQIQWGTKMGDTDVARLALPFIKRNTQVTEFAEHCVSSGLTPIFEFMSRKQRIVIDYGPEDRMVLLAVRDNVTGQYIDISRVESNWGIETAATDPTVSHHHIADLRQATGIEGYIAVFPNGHRLKIKTAEYVQFHKMKDAVASERNLVGLVLDNKIDDVLPLLPDNDKTRVNDFMLSFLPDLTRATVRLFDVLWDIRVNSITRKQFALSRSTRGINDIQSAIIFACWDDINSWSDHINVLRQIMITIERSLANESKYQSVKQALGISAVY